MQCALVNKITMRVENIIMADPAVDPYPEPATPDTHFFLLTPTDFFIEIGTLYDPVSGFKKPGAAPVIKGVFTL